MTHGTDAVLAGPDGPIGYSIHGEGPALFLIGGLGATRRLWGDFPALLGRSFRVVCPDNRGLGASRGGTPFTLSAQAGDLAALARHLDLDGASFLGASLGGPIVLETARLHPGLVRRMVLISCTARLSAHGRTLLGTLSEALQHLPPALFGHLLTNLSFAPPFHERHPLLVRQVAELYGPDPSDLEGTRAQLRHLLSGWDFRPHLGTLRVPALLLAGRRDPIVAVEETAALASLLPDARFRVFEDAAHSVLAEGGEEAIREVVAFLTEAKPTALGSLPALAGEAKVPVQVVTLDNGMKLLMVERHESPIITAGWVTHAGSVNERPGITGIAHLFEHMMFKGTETIGTKDYAAEKKIMDSLDAIRGQMEEEYTKLRAAKRRGEIEGNIYSPENQTPRLKELRAKMKELQDEQHKLIVKDEFDKVYTTEGGSGLNAFTNEDMTTFFITVPANKLELWFWMESGRLLHPVFREFYSERDVVREERRMRVESDPIEKFEEQFGSMFWTSIPYHHPVIGWPSDVESISRKQADEFFSTFYAPNNITAAIVGDFDPKQAVALAKKYFGRIPRGAQDPPEMITEEIEQLQEKRMSAEAETNPMVEIRWHTVPFVHQDKYALEVLAALLEGRTGRFYKSLVEQQHLATGEPWAWNNSMKYGGAFEIGAEVAEGHTHQEVEEALLTEIERLKKEPVGERELQKIKNQNLADSYRRLQSNFYLLLQLLVYDAEGDWRELNEGPGRIAAVTAADVQRVAETYFTKEGRNVMSYSRKAGTKEDPELAKLSGQAKQAAKQMLSQLEQVSDPAQLQQIITKLEGGKEQAPPQFKPALELVIERAKQRLATMQSTSGEEK